MASRQSNHSKIKPLKKRAADLADIAFERLRQAILTGELKEGERVRESRLAVEWKVGLTPLREAVRRMAAIGYLILQPNRAPIVRKLSADDIRQIYELRKVLESFALRSSWNTFAENELVAVRKLVTRIEVTSAAKSRLQLQFALDTKLHQLWVSPCFNPWLAAALDRLLIYRPNLMNLVINHRKGVEIAYEGHKRILAAIEKRDLKTALRALSKHIEQSGKTFSTLSK
jgi:DNA-binding GntR family transcriptional regulator